MQSDRATTTSSPGSALVWRRSAALFAIDGPPGTTKIKPVAVRAPTAAVESSDGRSAAVWARANARLARESASCATKASGAESTSTVPESRSVRSVTVSRSREKTASPGSPCSAARRASRSASTASATALRAAATSPGSASGSRVGFTYTMFPVSQNWPLRLSGLNGFSAHAGNAAAAVAAAAASQSVRRAIGARAVVVWSATRNKLVRSSMAAGWCSWAGAARKSTANKSR
ncbi:unnamed protein product [Pelagomonas calceolata]|uniref:Uncharacterized protein n=1 Tax=Pelagomonas calceolata TaxID=35677 RepID=A0A8J2SC32_9STRA|nr:unnamed protein product [Pelagomonas calceolata]